LGKNGDYKQVIIGVPSDTFGKHHDNHAGEKGAGWKVSERKDLAQLCSLGTLYLTPLCFGFFFSKTRK
jgi:hypothetical protein